MLIITLPLGLLETNCYIVASDGGGAAAVIDPVDDAESIISAAEDEELTITHILLTHGHFDHILALDELKKKTGATVAVHPQDASMLESGRNCLADELGIAYQPSSAEVLLEDGQDIEVGELRIKVLHTPGHTPGGVSFFLADGDEKAVFTGDALFSGSIGRTDLPGGSTEVLLQAIRQKLFTLPEETHVYPGHGPSSSIAHEKRHNPFFK